MAGSIAQEFDRLILPSGRALLVCGIISTSLLGGAFLFEIFGGLAPCSLCIWQRWVHAAIVLATLLGLSPLPRRPILGLVAVAAATSIAIAGYHAGVEWNLWQGPQGCTATLSSNLSTTALVDDLLATPVVRCDEVPWSLFGLSMAGWNALISIDILIVSLWGFARGKRRIIEGNNGQTPRY